jgi:hypothetical protein
VDTGSSELDLLPFSFSLYGYRLAIGYFRVVKGGGGNYPRFPCGFRGHGPTLCFWFWSLKSLGFGRPTGAVDSSLEAPRNYADVRVCSRAKTGLGLRDFKILFGVLFSIYTRRKASRYLFRYIVGVDVGIGWTVAESGFVRILVCYFVLSQGECFGL